MTDEKSTRSPTVGERLAALGRIKEERGAVYGDDYEHFGRVMTGMFPRGLLLETEEEFCRFGMFVLMQVKMSRYAQNIKRGGHADSLDDVAVYSQLQREVDEMRRVDKTWVDAAVGEKKP